LEYVDDDDDDDDDDDGGDHIENGQKAEVIQAIAAAEVGCCSDCQKHKKQIDMLIERQVYHEKQLIKLRKEYEDKYVLAKSLSISSASSTPNSNGSSSLITSLCKQQQQEQQITAEVTSATLTNQNNAADSNNTKPEWVNYWSSRPQAQPPKEWNFVHPNSSKSKLNNLDKLNAEENINTSSKSVKLLSKDNIGKMMFPIFTHLASFIVGATLMFLVFKRHFNVRSSSIYFV
jgi:hypothetical protein